MGTTGGDRVKLLETVQNAKNYAVIAPQMGKQVWHTTKKDLHLNSANLKVVNVSL